MLFLGLGWACLAGVAFLAQELARTWFNIAGLPSALEGGGWLDMSGAAWPSRWLYIAGHIWVIAAIIVARRLRLRPTRPMERILFGLLVASLSLVHALLWFTPLAHMRIAPKLL